jgi:DNA replication protein DnaC
MSDLSLKSMTKTFLLQKTAATWRERSFDARFAELLESEIKARYPAVARRKAGIPHAATLAAFTDPTERGLDADDIEALENIDWSVDVDDVWITGDRHSGRTWLASAIACAALDQGVKVVYTTADALELRLQKARGRRDADATRRAYLEPDLLVVDDLETSEPRHDRCWGIVAQRLRYVSTVVVTNPVDLDAVREERRPLLEGALQLNLRIGDEIKN